MIWEVELKFPLEDAAALPGRLLQRGATFQPPQQQVDDYFNHPARDFSQTDEAFRLRRAGQNNFITYKGPKVDLTTKTRPEIELPLPGGEGVLAQFRELFLALGFRPTGTVIKTRQTGTLAWSGHTVQIALDDVEHLGPFLELEIATVDDSVTSARSALHSLSEQLGLSVSERRSYLELLLLTRTPS